MQLISMIQVLAHPLSLTTPTRFPRLSSVLHLCAMRTEVELATPTPIRSEVPVDAVDMLYRLNDEECEFFKTTTGITNDDELKAHIFAVRREAYAVSRYDGL